MSIPFRAALVASLIAVPASAKPTSLLDLFSFDRLATFGAQWAITALRGVAEVTYDDMDLRPLQGRMTLTGLDIAPYDPELAGCKIHLDRAVITSAPLTQTAVSAVTVDLLGTTVSQACLDASGDNPLPAFGITDLVLDRGKLALNYTFASGALTADLQALSGELAEIRAHLAFDYFAIDLDNEEPVADLASAEVELYDLGVMAQFAPMIPPDFADPQALTAGMRMILLPEPEPAFAPDDDMAPVEPQPMPGNKAGGPKPPPMEPMEPVAPEAPVAGPDSADEFADVTAMIDQMSGELAGFVAAPGRLVLTLAPPAPVRLSDDTMGDFVSFARAMQPRLVAGALPAPTPVTASDRAAVEAWLGGDGAALAEPDALRVAGALLSGIGAPRDPARAMQVLTPLLDAGNPGALALALDQLDALPAAQAYRVARRAAASGDRQAFGQLDRLERGLGLIEAVAIQQEDTPLPALSGNESAPELREMGYGALSGLGAARSYGSAYFYGLVALAGGDRAAAAIVDEIEAMGDGLDEAAAQQWADFTGSVRAAASDAWFAAH